MRSELACVLIIALSLQSASAVCSSSTWYDFIRGFSLGMQKDNTDTTTDCYEAADNVVFKIFDVYNSGINYSYKHYLEPVTMVQQLLVEVTDWMNACNTVGLALQFDSRISTIPGAMDLLYALAVGYFTGNSLWVNGFQQTKTAHSSSCLDLGKNIGLISS